MSSVIEMVERALAPFISGERQWGRCFGSTGSGLGNENLPTQTGWRQLPIPRIHLLLSGQHRISLLHQGTPKAVDLHPGDVWYIPPNVYEQETSASTCCFAAIVFHQEYVRVIHVARCDDSPEAQLRKKVHWHHWYGQRPETLELALSILDQLGPSPEGDQVCREVARAFWAIATRWLKETNFAESGITPEGKAYRSWQRLLHYVQENAHLPIDRVSVAEALELHPSRLYALCQKYGGCDFRSLLEKQRQTMARRLLETTQWELKLIAGLCGYSGAPHFIRAFRRVNGVSPGRWRLTRS